MTTSNTASPLSTTRQDKKTPSHGSAPNGRARECRECAGDVAPERGRREGFRQVGSEPTRLSTTRAHARPTRHHDDFKYWPRRSSSASRGGRPGSPCGARESTQRGGFCSFLRGVMGARWRRRAAPREPSAPTCLSSCAQHADRSWKAPMRRQNNEDAQIQNQPRDVSIARRTQPARSHGTHPREATCRLCSWSCAGRSDRP